MPLAQEQAAAREGRVELVPEAAAPGRLKAEDREQAPAPLAERPAALRARRSPAATRARAGPEALLDPAAVREPT